MCWSLFLIKVQAYFEEYLRMTASILHDKQLKGYRENDVVSMRGMRS